MKALIFDLDGTLIDSVYAHTLAWQKVLSNFGLETPACSIHRRIGLSGELLVKAVAREQGRTLRPPDIRRLQQKHAALLPRLAPDCAPLPGAKALLAHLHTAKVAHGIATSGKRSGLKHALKGLALTPSTIVVDGDMVAQVKPEPEIFLLCQQKLGVETSQCLVVGDSIWDVHAARRAGILSIGLLTGGTSAQELSNAGAMRVFRDPAELLCEIDELGIHGG